MKGLTHVNPFIYSLERHPNTPLGDHMKYPTHQSAVDATEELLLAFKAADPLLTRKAGLAQIRQLLHDSKELARTEASLADWNALVNAVIALQGETSRA